MWGIPIPVSGIFTMSPYSGTRRDVCMKKFSTSVSVSDNANKNLVDFTHPISSTRSMNITMQSLSAANGMS